MKKVYIVVFNQMDECYTDNEVFCDYEQAKEAAEDLVAGVKDSYDEISQDGENSWLLIDASNTVGAIEIQHKEIK